MPEFWKILGGIAAFIIGQAVLQFVLTPIKDFHKERGDTSYFLLFHQAQITNASNTNPEASNDLKQMGAALISTMRQIPFYDFLVWLRIFGLPNKGDVFEAARELNGIVHALLPLPQKRGDEPARNVKALQDIARLLKIETRYSSSTLSGRSRSLDSR